MALEAVVFQQNPFTYAGKDYPWSYPPDRTYVDPDWEVSPPSTTAEQSNNVGEAVSNSSSSENCSDKFFAPVVGTGRRKRRRVKTVKNREDVENQRMTHIAVERNRRRQMNDYLSVLRSMMPPSYVQRGDQASIIGGAINFVKELEQLLQSLKAQKETTNRSPSDAKPIASLFSDFFTFPQYSTTGPNPVASHYACAEAEDNWATGVASTAAIADVEVTMVDSHANIKVLSRRQPAQLLKMVVGLHTLCLHVLHLTLTNVDNMVLYSFSVKVEENCQMNSVNEIAAAVYEMVGRIQDEAFIN